MDGKFRAEVSSYSARKSTATIAAHHGGKPMASFTAEYSG
jgi:hypothetical protein